VIPTPEIDWLALSPTLALLGASGLALLGSVLGPSWLRRAFGAFIVFAGFVTAGVSPRSSSTRPLRAAP
jgi:hypothetical protein